MPDAKYKIQAKCVRCGCTFSVPARAFKGIPGSLESQIRQTKYCPDCNKNKKKED